jgi:hypothetical protein
MRITGGTFWARHGGWCLGTLATAAAAGGWVLAVGLREGRWPGGGSLCGLVLGTLAGLIFLFETALAAKKTRWLRTARWSLPARTWMQAHLWLGLLTVPLVVLHSGGRLGGPLTSMLVGVFAIVILSGLWGLAMQQVLPRWLLDAVPSETIASQIDFLSAQSAQEARRLVALACGPSEVPPGWREDRASLDPQPVGVGVSVAAEQITGMVRSPQRLAPRRPHPARDLPPPVPAPALVRAVEETIAPYLAGEKAVAGQLDTPQQQSAYFDDLQMRVPPPLRDVVRELQSLCAQKRAWEVQRRLHFWLHHWLWLHLPLSLVLLVLLAAHVVLALALG